MKNAWYFPGILFAFLVLVDVLALALGFPHLHDVVKPTLMPMLAGTALIMFQSKSAPKPIIGFLLAALFFGTLGDILLMFPGKRQFVYGLLAFFSGHIFYMAILGSNIRQNSMTENPLSWGRIILYQIVAVCLPIIIVIATKLSLGASIYVGIYMWALITITFLAARCLCLGLKGGKFVLSGALLFIISDTMLGLNQFFGIDFPFRHPLVMLTYATAQALIVYGIGTFYSPLANRK